MDHALDPIASGGLARLRDQFSLSITMQAHLIGVPPHSLASWERGAASPSVVSMTKVRAWYEQAAKISESVNEFNLVPLSTASQLLGVGMATVREQCRTGELRCTDLGVLGVFVSRDDIQ